MDGIRLGWVHSMDRAYDCAYVVGTSRLRPSRMCPQSLSIAKHGHGEAAGIWNSGVREASTRGSFNELALEVVPHPARVDQSHLAE